MSVTNFDQLRLHYRHELEVALYGNPPVNATIECLQCNEVLLSFDKEENNVEDN
jgi:hypothetical protein